MTTLSKYKSYINEPISVRGGIGHPDQRYIGICIGVNPVVDELLIRNPLNHDVESLPRNRCRIDRPAEAKAAGVEK